MTPAKAKELGYTHHAKMYGYDGFYYDGEDETHETFIAQYKLSELMVEIIMWIDLTFEVNPGFPFLIGEEL